MAMNTGGTIGRNGRGVAGLGLGLAFGLGLGLGLMGGCATTGHAPARGAGGAMTDQDQAAGRVEADSYEALFDATRRVLEDYRFAINRVDAARGVLTTYPKRTAGLASLWDKEQSSLGQEWKDLVNQHKRLVRVRFERDPLGSGASATVLVELQRIHRPHWRVEPESVRLSTHARSRDTRGVATGASFDEVIGLDEALAGRLARAIDAKLASGIDAGASR